MVNMDLDLMHEIRSAWATLERFSNFLVKNG